MLIHKSKHLLTIMASIFLLLVLVGGYLLYVNRESADRDTALNQELVGDSESVSFDAKVNALVSEVITLGELGKSEEAISKLDTYLAQNTVDNRSRGFLYHTKARILSRNADNQNALTASLEAIKADATDPRYFSLAGDQYFLLSQKQSYLEYYQKALEVYDEGLPAAYNGPSREYFIRTLEDEVSND